MATVILNSEVISALDLGSMELHRPDQGYSVDFNAMVQYSLARSMHRVAVAGERAADALESLDRITREMEDRQRWS